jgi:hypothetical protein
MFWSPLSLDDQQVLFEYPFPVRRLDRRPAAFILVAVFELSAASELTKRLASFEQLQRIAIG